MTVEINVNVKVEGMSELIKAIESLAVRTPVHGVQAPIVAKAKEEKKDVTNISDVEVITPTTNPDPFEEFTKDAKVKDAKTKPAKKKEDKVVLASDDFFATPPETPKAEEKPSNPIKEITIENLRELGCKISNAGKTTAILALLKEYGLKKMTEVPEDKRAEFYAKASKLVA
jgi:hypothetical protein